MRTTTRSALPAIALVLLSTASAGAWPRRCHHQVVSPGPAAAPPSHSWVVTATDSIHVHDGDTFYTGNLAIRLRGIDTPELGQPRAIEAKWRLVQLLRSGPVTIVPRVEDVYGRTVADVYVGGRNVADVLRQEGFAKPVLAWGWRRRT